MGKQRLLDTRCSGTPATDVGASRCWRAVVRRWGVSIRRGCKPPAGVFGSEAVHLGRLQPGTGNAG